MLSKDTQDMLLAEYADVEAKAKAKYIHYNRNQLNTGDLPQTLQEASDAGWIVQPWIKNRYHNVGDASGNIKYVSEDGYMEAIFDPQGNLVNSAENMGTYNFYPNTNFDLHKKYDVEPYREWGNGPNDASNKEQRSAWTREGVIKATY